MSNVGRKYVKPNKICVVGLKIRTPLFFLSGNLVFSNRIIFNSQKFKLFIFIKIYRLMSKKPLWGKTFLILFTKTPSHTAKTETSEFLLMEKTCTTRMMAKNCLVILMVAWKIEFDKLFPNFIWYRANSFSSYHRYLN